MVQGHPVAPAQGCAMLREDQIKLVMGPDNRPTGEAFVEIAGPGANPALALAKDRQVMPVRHFPTWMWLHACVMQTRLLIRRTPGVPAVAELLCRAGQPAELVVRRGAELLAVRGDLLVDTGRAGSAGTDRWHLGLSGWAGTCCYGVASMRSQEPLLHCRGMFGLLLSSPHATSTLDLLTGTSVVWCPCVCSCVCVCVLVAVVCRSMRGALRGSHVACRRAVLAHCVHPTLCCTCTLNGIRICS